MVPASLTHALTSRTFATCVILQVPKILRGRVGVGVRDPLNSIPRNLLDPRVTQDFHGPWVASAWAADCAKR